MTQSRFVNLVVSVACGFFTFVAHARQSFEGLGHVDRSRQYGLYSTAKAVTPDGLVVVGATTSASGQEAFRWTRETGMLALGDLSGGDVGSVAYAVSADGRVVSGEGRIASGGRAVLWRDGDILDLGVLPGCTESHYALVSSDGRVVTGYSVSAQRGTQAFVWTFTKGMTVLPRLPASNPYGAPLAISADGRRIVGVSRDGTSDSPTLWESGNVISLGCLLGSGSDGFASAISPNGEIVVGYCNGAFRWSPTEGMVRLGDDSPLPHQLLIPTGAAADGSFVVGYGSYGHAMMWSPQTGSEGLQEFVERRLPGATLGWALTRATAITPDGSVVIGEGINPCGFAEAWMAKLDGPRPTVPPGSFPRCPGDINRDDRVDFGDLAILLNQFGLTVQCADTNGDGFVGFIDLNLLLAAFGSACLE